MHIEIMRDWVEALRSGQYAQGDAALRRTEDVEDSSTGQERYCVLGVLCELHRKATRSARWLHCSIHGDWFYGRRGLWAGDRDQSMCQLPDCVKSWAGMESEAGRLKDGTYLTERNDAGASFDELATLIERNAGTL